MPLFPLRTVLFPGMVLPLRVFEERYKTMVRELLETDGQFGVLLIREGQEIGGDAVPYDVGVMAHIEQWAALDEGRFALAARGARRFRLLEMLPARPYPFGEVELIYDDRPPYTEALATLVETVRTNFPLYFRMALSLSDQWARGMKLPEEAHALVNTIGPWLQAGEPTKQRLLEAESAEQRVSELASIIDELLARTREDVDEYRRTKYQGLGSQN